MSDVLRVVTTRLPLRVMWALSAAAVPLYYLYRLPVVGKIAAWRCRFRWSANWRWRWLDTFDWYTPKYQFKYLYPEVFRWFRDDGFHDVELLRRTDPHVAGKSDLPVEHDRDRQRAGAIWWRPEAEPAERPGRAGRRQASRSRLARWSRSPCILLLSPQTFFPVLKTRPHRAGRGGRGDRGACDRRDGPPASRSRRRVRRWRLRVALARLDGADGSVFVLARRQRGAADAITTSRRSCSSG